MKAAISYRPVLEGCGRPVNFAYIENRDGAQALWVGREEIVREGQLLGLKTAIVFLVILFPFLMLPSSSGPFLRDLGGVCLVL